MDSEENEKWINPWKNSYLLNVENAMFIMGQRMRTTYEADRADHLSKVASLEAQLSAMREAPPVTVPSQAMELLKRIRNAIHAGPVTSTGSRAGHVESLAIFGLVDEIDAALSSAPQEGQEGWIPVSERCPKLKPVDMVFDKSDRVAVIASGVKHVTRYKRWREDGLLEWGMPDVTHWMPLPDAPKPNSDSPDPELP